MASAHTKNEVSSEGSARQWISDTVALRNDFKNVVASQLIWWFDIFPHLTAACPINKVVFDFRDEKTLKSIAL